MTRLTAYLGVDPGASGSYCLLVPSTKQVAFYPTNNKPIETIDWFNRVTNQVNIAIVMIEDVHSLYGMSAKSNFSFGYNVGVVNIIPACVGLSIDKVTPKVWQKFVGVRAKGKEIKKDVASICDRLYPNASIRGPKGGLKDGKSDSLMIAHYASQTFKI